MKKMILALALSMTVTAQAKLSDYFDVEKFLSGALLISESINESLEQLRLQQHAKYDIQTQWDMLCDVNAKLKNNLEFADAMLNAYRLGQPACVPLSNALKLQISVMNRCNDFYNKQVQLNFDNVFSDVVTSVVESQQILSKCYPWVADFGL